MRAGPLPPPRPSPPRPKLTAGDKQQGSNIKWSQLSGTALVGQQGQAIAHHPQRPPRDGRPRSTCRGVSSPHSRSPSLGTPHEGGLEQGTGRRPLRWEDVPRVHHGPKGANGERAGRSGAPGPGAQGRRCSATVTAWGPLATPPGEGPRMQPGTTLPREPRWKGPSLQGRQAGAGARQWWRVGPGHLEHRAHTRAFSVPHAVFFSGKSEWVPSPACIRPTGQKEKTMT